MKTLLIGAGAIGGTVAVAVKNAGYDIRLLCHRASTKEKIESEGFFLHGAKGNLHADFTCYDGFDALGDEKFDIVIIATKYQAMFDAAKNVLPYLAESALVVGMQNGMLTERLAEIVGRDRAVGVMLGFGATRNDVNDVTMTSLGEIVIGMLDGRRPQLLDYLRAMLVNLLPTTISGEIQSVQYSKLVINSCINACAAITGCVLGDMADDVRTKTVFLEIAREGLRVAKGLGISVPTYGKVLNYKLFMLADNPVFNAAARGIVTVVMKSKYASVKPSTLQSLERGEITEIDAFNGYFVEKGKEVGVPTPVNEKLVQMIHEIEAGTRAISKDNLKEFEGMLY